MESVKRGLFVAVVFVLSAVPGVAGAQVKYIDAHAHIFGFARDRSDYSGQIDAALASMNQLGVTRTIIASLPQSPGLNWKQDFDELAGAVKKYPDRFAIMAGAGSLNVMIMEAVRDGKTSDALRRKFVVRAEQLAQLPIVAFGEMAADHFSQADWHPYEHAPPDHPLFLELSDIAAKYDLPIDLHMEAIENVATLGALHNSSKKSRLNPETLVPNIPGLERLLAHNTKTRIVWEHVGWDNTGQRTSALTRRLLANHPNLYLAIKLAPGAPTNPRFVARGSGIDPEWRAVIEEFPDRFMVGSDMFYFPAGADRRGIPPLAKNARFVLNSLPPALAKRIGVDNPLAVYSRLRQEDQRQTPVEQPSVTEIVGPLGLTARQVMEKFDEDHDGRLNREEFRRPPQIFNSVDADHDGFVTPAEMEAAWRTMRANRQGLRSSQ